MFLLNGLLHEKGLALTQPLSDFLTALISIPFLFYFFNILGKKAKMDKENTLLNKTV
jgi:hypothetical protein